MSAKIINGTKQFYEIYFLNHYFMALTFIIIKFNFLN